ncbi:EAL and HDOD domain-containing protein [Metabacillus bambusae]|uniref:HDOD domain-containing protein n=1 Tax=Metabacillus bambusae TaxID=2795218 RepID=A0ABS3MY07_9BACI|nr:HDOD domain-containing protein [Metabacillus bambusae]MBO1510823.1 HDOD domain-containing protein [Metabacillus bambusae]
MEVFVARQPIFNLNEEVIAYELLYRESHENIFPNIDGDQATTEVINSFLNIGINDLSEGKRCFVNFTQGLLQSRVPAFFNPASIVVEILENVEINEELITICKELKQQGYTIALDDFKIQESYTLLPSLIKYIDIIKVDFLETSHEERKRLVERYRPLQIELLAEKVETREEFLFARQVGYTYFQGYFFSRPVILSSYDVPMYLKTYYHILTELSRAEPDIEIISTEIERDLSLSYKLLKLINSPAFRRRNKIESIKQAIVLLGLNELKKWIYFLSVKSMEKTDDSKMQEVIKMSLIRAKLCEQIAVLTGRHQTAPYMLTGMFSLIDTLLHRNLVDILSDLPLSDEIQEALLGRRNDLYQVLSWALQIEHSYLNLEGLDLQKEDINKIYLQAIEWAKMLMKETIDVSA